MIEKNVSKKEIFKVNSKQPFGFTLIELLFTLVLLGIIVCIALPKYNRLANQNNMIRMETND